MEQLWAVPTVRCCRWEGWCWLEGSGGVCVVGGGNRHTDKLCWPGKGQAGSSGSIQAPTPSFTVPRC
jgi:hypothetical protein